MNRKYLDDIGMTSRPDRWNAYDHRQSIWAEQRKIYGFDDRETWSLDLSFYLWLYERLKRFKEIAGVIIDLTEYKFEYNDKTYNQFQLIDMILERLEFFFKEDYGAEGEKYNYVHEIEKIWAIILPVMWW